MYMHVHACTYIPVEDLQHYPLVNSKLCNDVSQQEVAVVLGCRVNALLGQETWPGKGHESPQLGALSLVVGVVDVRGRMLNQQGRKLQQQDAHRILVWHVQYKAVVGFIWSSLGELYMEFLGGNIVVGSK